MTAEEYIARMKIAKEKDPYGIHLFNTLNRAKIRQSNYIRIENDCPIVFTSSAVLEPSALEQELYGLRGLELNPQLVESLGGFLPFYLRQPMNQAFIAIYCPEERILETLCDENFTLRKCHDIGVESYVKEYFEVTKLMVPEGFYPGTSEYQHGIEIAPKANMQLRVFYETCAPCYVAHQHPEDLVTYVRQDEDPIKEGKLTGNQINDIERHKDHYCIGLFVDFLDTLVKKGIPFAVEGKYEEAYISHNLEAVA